MGRREAERVEENIQGAGIIKGTGKTRRWAEQKEEIRLKEGEPVEDS